ncbi:unnamed protein product [Gordionus sp. m RMFG-2023]|uniref:protein SREK1IP1-like n=1 Tax=Gordionus sp. m RMFG-2023 TaxID=3053472 RepID=UPI0030DF418A
MQNSFNLKEIAGKTNPNDINIRAACKKCGFVGHLPFQCRNYIILDPKREMILDVSSTSSDDGVSNFISPLVKLRDDEIKIEEMKKMIKATAFPLSNPIIDNDDILKRLKHSMKKRLKKKLKKDKRNSKYKKTQHSSSSSENEREPSHSHTRKHKRKKSRNLTTEKFPSKYRNRSGISSDERRSRTKRKKHRKH